MNLYYLTIRRVSSASIHHTEWSHSKLDLIGRGQQAIRAHNEDNDDNEADDDNLYIAQVRLVTFDFSGTVRQFVVDILNRSPITKKSILVWSLQSEKKRRKPVSEISPIGFDSEISVVSRRETPMISPIGISPVI